MPNNNRLPPDLLRKVFGHLVVLDFLSVGNKTLTEVVKDWPTRPSPKDFGPENKINILNVMRTCRYSRHMASDVICGEDTSEWKWTEENWTVCQRMMELREIEVWCKNGNEDWRALPESSGCDSRHVDQGMCWTGYCVWEECDEDAQKQPGRPPHSVISDSLLTSPWHLSKAPTPESPSPSSSPASLSSSSPSDSAASADPCSSSDSASSANPYSSSNNPPPSSSHSSPNSPPSCDSPCSTTRSSSSTLCAATRTRRNGSRETARYASSSPIVSLSLHTGPCSFRMKQLPWTKNPTPISSHFRQTSIASRSEKSMSQDHVLSVLGSRISLSFPGKVNIANHEMNLRLGTRKASSRLRRTMVRTSLGRSWMVGIVLVGLECALVSGLTVLILGMRQLYGWRGRWINLIGATS